MATRSHFDSGVNLSSAKRIYRSNIGTRFTNTCLANGVVVGSWPNINISSKHVGLFAVIFLFFFYGTYSLSHTHSVYYIPTYILPRTDRCTVRILLYARRKEFHYIFVVYARVYTFFYERVYVYTYVRTYTIMVPILCIIAHYAFTHA